MQETNHSGVVTLLAIAAVLTAGCSASGEDPAGLAASDTAAPPTAEATPTETPEATAADTSDAEAAELEELFLDYWDVVADLWDDPRIEVDPMLEVATDGRTETMMSYISSELIDNNARRVGEPEFSNITVTVDGDEAVIEACFDQSDWKLVADGSEVSIDLSEVQPVVAIAVKQDDRWLIDETRGPEEASIEC